MRQRAEFPAEIGRGLGIEANCKQTRRPPPSARPPRVASCRHSRLPGRTGCRAAPRRRTAQSSRPRPRAAERRSCRCCAASPISLATAHAHDADDVEQRHQRQQHGEQRAVARADARCLSSIVPSPMVIIAARSSCPCRDAVREQHGEDQKQVQQREMKHVPRAAFAGLFALAPHFDGNPGEQDAEYASGEAV